LKLIIQIPCYNEEESLPVTIRGIPRAFRGVDHYEILVVDDGSTDHTAEVAAREGVHHVVQLKNHKGLAEAFARGMDAALRLDADLIVNLDADNQYHAQDIQKLIDPILAGEADMVIGDRRIGQIAHFSIFKKGLQRMGSWIVRHISGTQIPDATSGFRAFSREAALRLNVISQFTYTLETVIQAGKKNIPVHHVEVAINEPIRPSRLFSNIPSYLKRSMATLMRIYALYEPLKVFLYVGALVFGIGFLISIRFLVYFVLNRGAGHIQSLILSAVLMIVGFQIGMIGLLADIISANRRLIEETLYRIKKMELDRSSHTRQGWPGKEKVK
jgi:glycosyltransferase involved in cell wall biosynthesis